MGRIEDLRLFVLVVESGGISRAAEKANIAKSAVSRRVALLEERYGTKLIDRSPGIWDVTEAGRKLHQRALRVVGEMDEDFFQCLGRFDRPVVLKRTARFWHFFLKFISDRLQEPAPRNSIVY